MNAHNLFDTLKFTQDAESVGIKREHAEFLAERIGAQRADLVTKSDLRSELKILQRDILLRIGGMLGIVTAILGYIGKHG